MTEQQALELILKHLEVSLAYRECELARFIEDGNTETFTRLKAIEILRNLDTSSPFVIVDQIKNVRAEAKRDSSRFKQSAEDRKAYHHAVGMLVFASSELSTIEMFVDAIDE